MRPILTLDNFIEIFGFTGDLDAFLYGGGVIYRDKRRMVYLYSFWDSPDDHEKNYIVYTAILNDIDKNYNLDIKELILGSANELNEKDIKSIINGRNFKEKANLIDLISNINGKSFFPSEELSPFEMASRWGQAFGVEPSSVPQIEYNDYLIRAHKNGSDWEAGCLNGDYLGRFGKYKDALRSILKHANDIANEKYNVYHEHEKYKIEIISLNKEDFAISNELIKYRKNPFWNNIIKIYIDDKMIKRYNENSIKLSQDLIKKRRRFETNIKRQAKIEKARKIRAQLWAD